MDTLLGLLPLKANVRLLRWLPAPNCALDGCWDLVAAAHNLVVTSGKILVARVMSDEAGWDTGLTHAEIGEGNTAPTVADVALDNPTARQALVSNPVRSGNVVSYRTFFPAPLVSVQIEETGIYGHSTATATIGTGEMFARALLSYDNLTDPHDLTVIWSVTYG